MKPILKGRKSLERPRSPLAKEAVLSHLFSSYSPSNGAFISQEVLDLFPAPLLMAGVCSKSIQGPADTTGCGVMALKHEGVHLSTQVLV